MKRAKSLTREQKEIVSNNALIASQWMLVEDLGSYLKIMHKDTKKIRIINKYTRGIKR